MVDPKLRRLQPINVELLKGLNSDGKEHEEIGEHTDGREAGRESGQDGDQLNHESKARQAVTRESTNSRAEVRRVTVARQGHPK